MANKKLPYALSISTTVDDFGWPWTAISSNFLQNLRCQTLNAFIRWRHCCASVRLSWFIHDTVMHLRSDSSKGTTNFYLTDWLMEHVTELMIMRMMMMMMMMTDYHKFPMSIDSRNIMQITVNDKVGHFWTQCIQ